MKKQIKEKIDIELLTKIKAESQEVFLVVKNGEYDAVYSLLKKQGYKIQRNYSQLNLILIEADTDSLVALAEDERIIRITSSKGKIELYDKNK